LRSSIVFIAVAEISEPNRFRTAGKSSKRPLESRQGSFCFLGAWRRMVFPPIALPSAMASGVVAKDSDATYKERRSRKWLKIKVHHNEEFVIGGFTAPAGARQHLGALY
jgi:hypothetical protein